MSRPGSPSLTIVGTGIRAGVHLTPEAREAIEAADELLYVASDPVAERWLKSLHPRTQSLNSLYRTGMVRREIYDAMVEAILAPLRTGRSVCAAFYGHPGVFVYPSHEAIRRAHNEGFGARMLPAVSAEDCLVADLGVDPRHGWQSYEATEFLVHARVPVTSAALVLWQVGLIGAVRWEEVLQVDGLGVLAEYLQRYYPPAHDVTLYSASPFPIFDAQVEVFPLARLGDAAADSSSTLYVPPSAKPRPDPLMLERLGMTAR